MLPVGHENVPGRWSPPSWIARLCEPSSELYVAERWYERTALEDLLGVAAERINEDRLYRLLDHLVWHKSDIEHHLRNRLGELFAIDYDLLLYDVTSTYFEGLAPRNEMARRGHSRDQRADCLQVCIALVVTREGMPLGYEVFDGNTTDVTTVKTIVGTMEARYGLAQRIWVMDRGMCSKGNIHWLQQTGRRYLVGAPRSILPRFAEQLADAQGWQSVHDEVEVKLCTEPGNPHELFVVCRSTQRRVKEQAMHTRFSLRIESALTRLAGRIERSKKPIDRQQVERQVGRLLQRNSHAAKRYQIRFETAPDQPAQLQLRWSVDSTWEDWAAQSEGSMCSRPTSWTGRPKRCGRPTSSSPRRSRPSAFTRVIFPCGPFGTSGRTGSKRISWSVSWPTSSGKPWSSGSPRPSSATVHVSYSTGCARFTVSTWRCH
ncbi:MAG: IS1634 family transposase [Candidatus Binatia bacterium]